MFISLQAHLALEETAACADRARNTMISVSGGRAVKTTAKPRVFVSYTWRPDEPVDPNAGSEDVRQSNDRTKARGLTLANRLRAERTTWQNRPVLRPGSSWIRTTSSPAR
jgi:hypothetical protein